MKRRGWKGLDVDTIVFYLCAVDILFLPYIRSLSASITMLLLSLWFLFNLSRVKSGRDAVAAFVLASTSLGSLIISRFSVTPAVFSSNLVNTVILIFGVLSFLFFRCFFLTHNVRLTALLSSYLAFGGVLAGVYYVSPSRYFTVRSFWTMSGQVLEATDYLTISRFTGTFSDPNNASIAFVGVMAFLLFSSGLGALGKILSILLTLFVIVPTMSSTGFIAFGVCVLLYVIKVLRSRFPKRISPRAVLQFLLLVAAVPLIASLIVDLAGNRVAEAALERVGENSADSRFQIWSTLLGEENILRYLFLGGGGNVIVGGSAYAPHSGHLHLIYGYGLIAYVAFMFIYFRKRTATTWADYAFLVPFLLGFTMNVGIYEPRFLFLLSLLTGYYATQGSRKRIWGQEVEETAPMRGRRVGVVDSSASAHRWQHQPRVNAPVIAGSASVEMAESVDAERRLVVRRGTQDTLSSGFDSSG